MAGRRDDTFKPPGPIPYLEADFLSESNSEMAVALNPIYDASSVLSLLNTLCGSM